MKFLRNPEIKKQLLFCAVSMVFFFVVSLKISTAANLLICAVGFYFIIFHLITTWQRYQRLTKLSCELDSMLHHQTPIHFEEYAEGELSILQSELSKMTLRLAEQAQALQKDKTYLADSMADISHQLRSPLTSIRLILSLLSDPELKEQKRSELLRELTALLSRIDWLVESLLKMSKMDAGTVYLKKASVPVSELFQRAAEPLLIPMELREQTLAYKPKTGNEQFIGDITWSTEALLNILKNGMENTPCGSAITVSSSENTLFTEIKVEDNGPGFSKKDLPHLFERFYKGCHASDQSVGIGLALARRILTRQNGTLKAENRPDGGARFIIKFYK